MLNYLIVIPQPFFTIVDNTYRYNFVKFVIVTNKIS